MQKQPWIILKARLTPGEVRNLTNLGAYMAIVYLIDNNFYEFWGALQNSIVRGVTYRLPRLLVNLAMIILAQTDWPVQWRILKCKLYKLYILSFNKTAVGL